MKKTRTNFFTQSTTSLNYIKNERVQAILNMSKSDVFTEACEFLRKNSSSIELLRNGKLEKVLFYLPTYSNFLKSNLQNEYEV
jgi:hypothetical protein